MTELSRLQPNNYTHFALFVFGSNNKSSYLTLLLSCYISTYYPPKIRYLSPRGMNFSTPSSQSQCPLIRYRITTAPTSKPFLNLRPPKFGSAMEIIDSRMATNSPHVIIISVCSFVTKLYSV